MADNIQNGAGLGLYFARKQGGDGTGDNSGYAGVARYIPPISGAGPLVTPGGSAALPVRWNASGYKVEDYPVRNSDGTFTHYAYTGSPLENYPALGSDWLLTETWSLTCTGPDSRSIVATSDSPNGYSVTRSGEATWDTVLTGQPIPGFGGGSSGTATVYSQVDKPGLLTVTTPGTALCGIYQLTYGLTWVYTGLTDSNPYGGASVTVQAHYDTSFIIRFPGMTLVPPPGSPDGTPADVIYLELSPYVNLPQYYATIFFQMDPQTGLSLANAQRFSPPVTIQLKDDATIYFNMRPIFFRSPPYPNDGYFDPYNPALTINDQSLNWPNAEVGAFVAQILPGGAVIYGLNVPLPYIGVGIPITYYAYSPAHFDPFPTPKDQYGLAPLEEDSATLLSASYVPNPPQVLTDGPTYENCTGDFFAKFVVILGKPPSSAPKTASGPTHAQDVSSGRVSVVQSAAGATPSDPRQLQATVWEGWQSLTGTPARAAQPILGPDEQPVVGDFPHLWKVSEEGVASLVYRNADGDIVRAISRDGLYTLEAPIS